MMFKNTNICFYCKKSFYKKETVVRWVTSNILKFDFSDVSKFIYIYPLHYSCIKDMKKIIDPFNRLQDSDFEAGEIEYLIKNTQKHIEFYKK